jgi:segregation and condensation protein B
MNTSAMNLEHTLEALLFWKGEPVTVKELAKTLSVQETEITEALNALEQTLQNRGITLLRKNTIDRNGAVNPAEEEVMLGTSKEAGELIEKLTRDDLSKDLGKASLETLSIVIYKGPVKRSEIDNIRGVNSNFILRNLLVRGLIDKRPDPRDSRATLYAPSFELLSYLGVSKIEDLPNFAEVQEEIQKFKDHTEALKSDTPADAEPTEVRAQEQVTEDKDLSA